MSEMTSADFLLCLSNASAAAVDCAARSVVAVDGRDRVGASGVLWRDGVVVAASDAVERDDDLAVTLPDGKRIAATLAGRDPTTDIAVLRVESGQGAAIAEPGDAASLRPGHFAFALGRRGGSGAETVASLGILATSGGAWRSLRGGVIDRRIAVARRN